MQVDCFPPAPAVAALFEVKIQKSEKGRDENDFEIDSGIYSRSFEDIILR